MTTRNSANFIFTKLADGWELIAGTILRKLKVTGADVTLTGSGSNVHTFPSTSATLMSDAGNEIHVLTSKSTPVDNDELLGEDSAASWAKKRFSLTNLWTNYFKSKADALYGLPIKLSEVVVYTANGTWTKATYPNLYGIRVRLVGGGGGSGGVDGVASQIGCSDGGGGGGYSEKFIPAASLGTTESVTIGVGGAGGAAGANNGSAGGTTSFGTHLQATGGNGSAGVTASATVPRIGALPVFGGVGSGGDVNIYGDIGETAIMLSITIGKSGRGGSSMFGSGGRPRVSSQAGGAGLSYGAGAGGAMATNATDRAGAAGTDGIVIVEIYKQ